MKKAHLLFPLFFLLANWSTAQTLLNTEKDRKAIEQTSIGIRGAFAAENIPAILAYHHPEVVKALAYNKFINGQKELEADLKNTLQYVRLVWKENKLESLLFDGNSAVEMTAFTIEGTPKDGSKPFTFKGRAMIVYVRSDKSPSGWVSIREVVQPATE
ncbi:hypothetical protein BH09BAC4_BH09BAC4_08750 [soil metagenome]